METRKLCNLNKLQSIVHPFPSWVLCVPGTSPKTISKLPLVAHMGSFASQDAIQNKDHHTLCGHKVIWLLNYPTFWTDSQQTYPR